MLVEKLTANVSSPDLALLDEIVSGTGDEVSLALETEVSEHHSSREHKSDRIGLVGAHDVLTDVTASRFEKGVFLWLETKSACQTDRFGKATYSAKVATRGDTGTTDEGGTNVCGDGAVQVGLPRRSALPSLKAIQIQDTHHNHNIELLRLRDKLHSSVVDNHRLKLDTGVAILLLGDSFAGVEEKTVTELHNVSLVDTSDLLLVSQASAKLSKQYKNSAEEIRTFLLFLRAKSKANLAIRSALALVETFKDSTTPGKDWCSRPEYSPSVFSRIIAKSTLECRVAKPGRDLQTTTEA